MTQYLQLRSTAKSSGELELSLAQVDLPDPGAEEVTIRIEATPINPSDLGTLIAGADLEQAASRVHDGRPVLTAPIPASAIPGLAARLDQSMPVGNEGAGVVVAAGSSDGAQSLLGKTVATLADGMYAQYRSVPAKACLVLPDGVAPRDAASCFVNPLTALGMVETMKLEGHSALVHTAAASNLGQMLVKLCLADGVPLVNIVRSEAQVALLRAVGATHICNSSDADFHDRLTHALEQTGATLAFDAVAGGKLASDILAAMERVASRNPDPANRYGSTIHKQVYLYGVLDTAPTVLDRSYGMAWGIGGWLMPNFLARIGQERSAALRQRVASEITTTFASTYTEEISLAQALDAATARRYQRKSTGEKFLINPTLDV